ncbi:hypothetical protein B9Z55_001540 [Caenorhabditis nigoni]|uniref:Uncharacterized protein n=1 Tax=Caenorhabditis nigoni TaxID=1611254 RepID=A0A2G5VGP1_9PELO|nr:hypothetical protein B9Z55_001540 [Caenorhabditis nigoni]
MFVVLFVDGLYWTHVNVRSKVAIANSKHWAIFTTSDSLRRPDIVSIVFLVLDYTGHHSFYPKKVPFNPVAHFSEYVPRWPSGRRRETYVLIRATDRGFESRPGQYLFAFVFDLITASERCQ